MRWWSWERLSACWSPSPALAGEGGHRASKDAHLRRAFAPDEDRRNFDDPHPTLTRDSGRGGSPPSDHFARDDDAHDFVGSLENLMLPQIAHDLLDAVIGEIAVAAEHLQRLIGDIEPSIGGEPLRHRAQPRRVGRL